MEQEFKEFFQYIEKDESLSQKDIKIILKPLKYLLLKELLIKYLKITLVIAAICYGVYYIDTLNWWFCAVGRVFLIKILPIWDWTYLGREKCLIPKSAVKTSYEPNQFDTRDCRACEYFKHIDVVKETTYGFIHDKYLIRGLPVIVSDTIKILNNSESLVSYINSISINMSDMITASPCNFETNLMMSKYANLDEAFAILKKSLDDGSDTMPWFISFRNCRTRALKASRLMMPKPYFYPKNLQAPYTTWVVLSNNYKNYQKDLDVYGLIIVTQLKGSIKATLKAHKSCQTFCQDLSVTLYSGESLVFLSGLWTFSYEHIEDESYSATYITETYMN